MRGSLEENALKPSRIKCMKARSSEKRKNGLLEENAPKR
jgi:hypothetical protein